MSAPRLITHNGKTQSIAEWAAQLGINYRTLVSRINNWGADAALSCSERRVKHPGNRCSRPQPKSHPWKRFYPHEVRS
jgi:hypothetical protein